MNAPEFRQDNSSLVGSLPFSGNRSLSPSVDHEGIYVTRFKPSEAVVSDEMREIFEYVVSFLMCFTTGTIGIVSNIAIMIVFAKQGFQDTINISLTTMALWDLIKCISFVAFSLHQPVSDSSKVLGTSWYYICGSSFIYIFFFAGYVSSAIAAYVAVERCLCVCMPFTVKFLLTTKITTIVNVVLSVTVFTACAVQYNQLRLIWFLNPDFNKTIAVRIVSPSYIEGITVYYNALSISLPVICFVIISISTALIFYQLVKSSKFRASMAEFDKKDNPNQLSTRDKRVIKMLLVILSLYLATTIPRLARYFAKVTVPGFKHRGYFNNVFFVSTYLMYFFDLINAAVNIFVFYSMSQQFQSTFKETFLSKCGRRVTN